MAPSYFQLTMLSDEPKRGTLLPPLQFLLFFLYPFQKHESIGLLITFIQLIGKLVYLPDQSKLGRSWLIRMQQ